MRRIRYSRLKEAAHGEGVYANSIGFGVVRKKFGLGRGTGKAKAERDCLSFALWWERELQRRLQREHWFEDKKGAPRLRVVMGTKCGSLQL